MGKHSLDLCFSRLLFTWLGCALVLNLHLLLSTIIPRKGNLLYFEMDVAVE